MLLHSPRLPAATCLHRSAACRPRALALAVRGALLALTLGLGLPPSPAHAVAPLDNSAAKAYAIAAGPLGHALAQFAAASGVALSFDPAPLAALHSKGLQGSYTARQGFAHLLDGSGYELADKGDGAFTVRKSAPPVPGGNVLTLPAVTVKAQAGRETAWGPVDGYVARRSATGTKTDTLLIETPQSISVVGTGEIDLFKAQNLTDALGYTAGVARSEGVSRTTDNLVIRGFSANTELGSVYRDGSKYLVNVYNGRLEPYGLERIEVLKGASSVLYGMSAPGGVINTVSKRPGVVPLREFNLELGSFRRKQISADLGGALSEDGAWSYRLTALHRDAGTFIDHVPDNRSYVAPALKWQPSAATSLTVLAEYQKDRSVEVFGLPAAGTVQPNLNGRIARSTFIGEPGYDNYANKRHAFGYLFEHAASDALTLRHSLRYLHSENDAPMIWPVFPLSNALAGDQRTLSRWLAQDRLDRSSAVIADTALQYQWTAGGIVHTSLAGFDYLREKHRSERHDRTVSSLDIFTPVYGAALGNAVENEGWSGQRRGKRLGIYAQDQMKIANKWVLLLGGRQDWVRNDEGTVFSTNWYTENERSHALTGRAGVVYLADNGLAPFLSFSQAYQPASGRDRNEIRFKPTTGEQYEAGLRYQPAGTDAMLSAAVYQLTQKNSLVSDPVNTNFSAQLGEVRSRGIELEAKAEVGRHAHLIAAYAYTDARTIRSSPLTPAQEGKRTSNVPYNQLSLWGDYRFGAFGMAGLKIGAGVRYVDSTLGRVAGVTVPSFMLVDAMISYSAGPWQLALNASNLTDKTYIASCTYGCFYGESRKLIATAGYRW